MHSRHLVLLPLYASVALADSLLPTYPPPVDLSGSDSLVSAAWRNLTSLLDAYLEHHVKNRNTTALSDVEDITFSAGLFSIHDQSAKELQYHYTSPEVAHSKNGTRKVNGDSIYRIASASKLFTVYAGLLSLTEEEWNRPLSHINPRLAQMAVKGNKDPIWDVGWDKITPWALASQISGIPREGWAPGDTLFNYTLLAFLGAGPLENLVTAWGMPPIDIDELGKCWNVSNTCAYTDIISVLPPQPPAFLPWSTPMYANANFMLLGQMISRITGQDMQSIYQEALFDPLNLESSFSSPPKRHADLARSVIVGSPEEGFTIDIPLTIPSGGIFSTTNDLAKFGTSILNSTLLPANTTRKWMKPSTHTASLTYSLGAPWEIIRYVHPDTGRVTDLYTKLGDAGFYGSNIVLIPQYGAGFSIINAGSTTERGELANVLLDYITTTIMPALESQAAVEAQKNYVGTYVSTAPSLNSSMTIAFNKSTIATPKSGLSITEWISNGTDMLNSDLFLGIRPRLLPSILKQTPEGEKGEVAFQASLVEQTNAYFAPGAAKAGAIGPFTGQYKTNYDWLTTDATHYGGKGTCLFVFDVDGDGRATAVSPAAARVKLERKE